MNKQELLAYAQKNYPIGTKFIPVNSNIESVITTGLFDFNLVGGINEFSEKGSYLFKEVDNKAIYHCIYFQGDWAKIISTLSDEKKIKEAARIHAHLKENFDRAEEEYYNSKAINAYESFQAGAKSEEAKAYHTKGMYSEEEVLNILKDLLKLKAIEYDGEFCVDLWFENKKK